MAFRFPESGLGPTRSMMTGVTLQGIRYRETLPNGVAYTTLALTMPSFYNDTSVYTVPSNHYFVLGDNRNNSIDSRMLKQVGYVPLENMIGRAEFIYFSAGDHGGVRWDRLFQAVR